LPVDVAGDGVGAAGLVGAVPLVDVGAVAVLLGLVAPEVVGNPGAVTDDGFAVVRAVVVSTLKSPVIASWTSGKWGMTGSVTALRTART
jgi:hypothetical protein